MVFTQQSHHVFRVRTLGEASEASQIGEECGNLPAMTFELLLRARCDNQISHLWRKESPQPTHSLDFAYLLCDPLFELLVQPLHFLSSLAKFLEQPRVLDSDNGLRGKVRDQRSACR
jgi:hypothetical protein